MIPVFLVFGGINVTLRFKGLESFFRTGSSTTFGLFNRWATFFISSGSSSIGITAAISSGSKLSSLGALSLP